MMEDDAPKVNFVPCLKWIKRGVAKSNPEKVQLSKDELAQIIKDTQEKLKVEDEGESSQQDGEPDDEYDFGKYDNEDEENSNALGIASLAIEEPEQEFSDSDSEKEDDLIKSDDNLIVVGHVEGDASIMEIYVYNENEGSFYVHHDFILPAFPLCFEWLDHEPGASTPGNLCAVGSMSPIIEVWDLDIVNCLESAYKLGRKASRKKGLTQIGHTDAVLDLSWNKDFHHILASGSVDQTILLWDLDQGIPHSTLTAFQDKVQCLEWHKLEAQTLLGGGCDSTARVFDCRTADSFQTWKLSGEAERVIWNPFEPFSFLAATSTGKVHCFDCRKGELWSMQAHDKEVTGLAMSGQCPGLLVTASPDGLLNTWDFAAASENGPVLVHSKEFKMGVLHCLELCPDSPFVVAAGGDKRDNNFSVIDLSNIDPVKHTFGNRPLIQLVKSENEPEVKTEEIPVIQLVKSENEPEVKTEETSESMDT